MRFKVKLEYSCQMLKFKNSLKSAKSNLHKSFVTNQDLIQGIRNQSFVSSRHPSSRLHTQKSQVSLLKKKSYERLHTDKQNSSAIANQGCKIKVLSFSDSAITMLQDCLTSLGQNNMKIQHKLKKVLGYIREIVQEKRKMEIDLKKQISEYEKQIKLKLTEWEDERSKLKKSNEELKSKLMQYRQKILTVRKDVKSLDKDKQPIGLHQIVINQSQIIDQQCEQYSQQNHQMRRMLQIQALKIQEMLSTSSKTVKQIELSEYISLGSSFLKRNR